jgi:hypothetical protein
LHRELPQFGLSIAIAPTRLLTTYVTDVTKSTDGWAPSLVAPFKGIDGRLFFRDDEAKGQTKQIVFSVKSGATSVAMFATCAES